MSVVMLMMITSSPEVARKIFWKQVIMKMVHKLYSFPFINLFYFQSFHEFAQTAHFQF